MKEKMKSPKFWAIAGASLLVTAAVVWLLLSLIAQASARQFESRMAQVIPSDSDMVVIVPAATADSQKWWESVSGFVSTDTRLNNVKPYENKEFEVETYGYSRSKNHTPPSEETAGILFAGPVQNIYIESSNEASAAKVEDWLTNTALETGYDTVATRVGNINIISRKATLDSYSNSMKDNAVSAIATRGDFKFQSPMMWVNFDEQRTVLSTGGDELKSGAVNEMFTSGLGIEKGTVWQSTSTDGGAIWKGNYVSGGVKAGNINPEKASIAFESDAKNVSTQTNRGDPNAPAKAATGEVTIIAPGLSAMLDYISIDYSDDSKGSIGKDTNRPEGEKSLVSADLNLIAWNNLTGKSNLGQNGYSTQSIRADENGMSMNFVKFDSSSVPSNSGTGTAPIQRDVNAPPTVVPTIPPVLSGG
jgi:hypothetical protein